MRNDLLDLAKFGKLAYVCTQRLAKVELLGTFSDANRNPATYYASLVTWLGSGTTHISQLGGHSFAHSDPASTSGHPYPAFGLKSNGIDPDTGVQGIYAGSHTASIEALLNHKVDAGEVNIDRIATAMAAAHYSPAQFDTLWQSGPVPQDPIAVRSNLSPAFKEKIKSELPYFDFSTLSPEVQDMVQSDVAMSGTHLVPDGDSYFDEFREVGFNNEREPRRVVTR